MKRAEELAAKNSGKVIPRELMLRDADRLQREKEERIIEAGGLYIRDKETGQLHSVEGISEIRRQK